MAPDLAAKRLEILNATVPTARRVAMLYNVAIPPSEVALKEMKEAAERLQLELRPVPIRATGVPVGERSAEGFDDALRMIATEKADSLAVFSDPVTHRHQTIIVRFADEHHLPTLYADRGFVDAGGLISYGPNYPDMFRRGAYFVDRILRGVKPADLPVEQPSKFELVLNLKTAKALGLDVPPSLLIRATEVIE
jgi:putative ABC transport system substrate-binding protein